MSKLKDIKGKGKATKEEVAWLVTEVEALRGEQTQVLSDLVSAGEAVAELKGKMFDLLTGELKKVGRTSRPPGVVARSGQAENISSYAKRELIEDLLQKIKDL
jgi:hypothetical protein